LAVIPTEQRAANDQRAARNRLHRHYFATHGQALAQYSRPVLDQTFGQVHPAVDGHPVAHPFINRQSDESREVDLPSV
jgi:preprotein translocase subunit SecD